MRHLAGWTFDRRDAIAVCRPGLVLPLAVVTIPLAIVYVVTRPHESTDVLLFLALWALFALAVAIGLRGALIHTPNSLLYRPPWGQILQVPIAGIKRFSLLEPDKGVDGEVELLRIELWVGGTTDIPLDVRKSEKILDALNALMKARN